MGTTYWIHTQYVKYDMLIPGKEYTVLCNGNIADFSYYTIGHANNGSYNQVRVNQLNVPVKFTAIDKPSDGRLTFVLNCCVASINSLELVVLSL